MSPTSLCGRKIRCKYSLMFLFTQVLSVILIRGQPFHSTSCFFIQAGYLFGLPLFVGGK